MKALQRIVWLALVGMLVGATEAAAQFDAPAAEPGASKAPAAPEPDAEPAASPFDPVPAEPAPDAEPADAPFDPVPADPEPEADPADAPPQKAPAAPEPFDPAPFDPDAPVKPAVPPGPAPEPGAAPYSPLPDPPQSTIPPAPPTGMRSAIDPFMPPAGMVTSPHCLIQCMGFYGHDPFVYSAANCFDLASACYKYGYYEDAIALLSHAIEQEPMAHYYYLRGMSQMQAGLSYDAIESADGVYAALRAGRAGGLAPVRERFNGPVAWQFRQLINMRGPAVGRQ